MSHGKQMVHAAFGALAGAVNVLFETPPKEIFTAVNAEACLYYVGPFGRRLYGPSNRVLKKLYPNKNIEFENETEARIYETQSPVFAQDFKDNMFAINILKTTNSMFLWCFFPLATENTTRSFPVAIVRQTTANHTKSLQWLNAQETMSVGCRDHIVNRRCGTVEEDDIIIEDAEPRAVRRRLDDKKTMADVYTSICEFYEGNRAQEMRDKVRAIFEEQDICFNAFMRMTKDDLSSIGITSLGLQMCLLDIISNMSTD